MDTTYAMYQLRSELWQLLLANWKSNLATVKYWGIVAFIVIAYLVWFRLTDKKRLVDLLFYGSLIAVLRGLLDLYGVTAGLWIYKYTILPLSPSVLLVDWTILPLMFMLVQQYSPSWRRFFVLNAIASGLFAGVIAPAFIALGILQLMHWNYPYTFIMMYIGATFARAAFHLVVQVQNAAREGNPSPLESTLMHPAFKPLDEKGTEDDDKA